jgi:hypothetical protein
MEEPQYHREGMAFGIDCIGQLRHSQLNLWALSLKEEEGGIYVQNHSERETECVCVSQHDNPTGSAARSCALPSD